jgi:NitT/TauT family transport system substrate-binding protein
MKEIYLQKGTFRCIGSVIVMLIVVVLLAFIGCGEKKAKEPLKIATFTWPGHGPFYVAREKGFFAEENVEVVLSRIDAAAERRAAIGAGRIDAIATGLEEVIILRDKGVDLKAVLETDQSNGADGLVAKKNIQETKDLKGKIVAYEEGSPSHIFLTQVLKKAGLTTKDIIPKYMSPAEAGAAFTSDKVDAAVTWEPWLTKSKEKTDSHLLISSAEEPGLIAAVLAVRNESLEKRRSEWLAVLRAWFKAVEFCKKNPDEAHKIMSNVYELPIPDVAAMLQTDLIAGTQENITYFGKEEENGVIYGFQRAISEEWLAVGLIQQIEQPDKAIDPTLLRNIWKNSQ